MVKVVASPLVFPYVASVESSRITFHAKDFAESKECLIFAPVNEFVRNAYGNNDQENAGDADASVGIPSTEDERGNATNSYVFD